jgi:hypothetical protein
LEIFGSGYRRDPPLSNMPGTDATPVQHGNIYLAI